MSPGGAGDLVEVATPQGPGRFHVSEADAAVALLVLGHGAGGGVDAPDLTALALRLPERGVTVLRYEQPWRVAGRRIAVRPPLLDEAWLAGLDAVREAFDAGLPLVRFPLAETAAAHRAVQDAVTGMVLIDV